MLLSTRRLVVSCARARAGEATATTKRRAARARLWKSIFVCWKMGLVCVCSVEWEGGRVLELCRYDAGVKEQQ